jgi:hypothetical protein
MHAEHKAPRGWLPGRGNKKGTIYQSDTTDIILKYQEQQQEYTHTTDHSYYFDY